MLAFFLKLLPARALYDLPALKNISFHERLFTPLVTLWYLLFQWVNHDHTLEAVLADAHAGGADSLNPKLSSQIISSSTGPYSDARKRLPPDFLAQALRLQGREITAFSSGTWWKGPPVALLDGTTIRLRPHGDIPKHFPPHRNQHKKKAYWCLLRTVVAFCGHTGAVLDCAMGSMQVSEQALAGEIFRAAQGERLFLGDRNFGIFRVAQAARQAGQQVLLRLKNDRAAKILGHPLAEGDFPVRWKHSRHDQLERGCRTESISGRVIVRRLEPPGAPPQWLCLFTTLPAAGQHSGAELGELYRLRWHAELNLRYVKAQMQAGQLEVRSDEMARKQWLACLLAYNLIRAAALCGALQAGLNPLALSFSACRRHLEKWLRNYGQGRGRVLVSWEKLLHRLSASRLLRRRKPRPSEPRAKHYVRESFPPLKGSRAEARDKLLASKLKT